ncbi:MAG: histidine phosphatase family protein [Pseudomonas sp.]|uniref:lipopolysaccharide core heptose(II)-phosphate phosphatase PmrG n=1 Tax=Pseudomonas abieticivorans TaxID=2931382 RepID=UPI0020BDCFC5|nr:histidine phosphatase family protein [Pseudomonas sp. PIA16]MDE1169158.1 histidine phosphatase family protein [Pseudomonas sp.]
MAVSFTKSRFNRWALGVGALTVPLLVAGFAAWQKSPTDLGHRGALDASGLYRQWQRGNVVVIVRHVERCDRSGHPCLGPEDGISLQGDAAAAQMGQAFNRLGMAHTDVVTSPLIRTQQTAHSMFGVPSPQLAWLYTCDKTMLAQIARYKGPQRNLMLVTHSACMSKIESTLGYAHADASDYGSALFISLAHAGKPRVLGVMQAQDWQAAQLKGQ